MAEIIWSERATLDVENIYDYIFQDSFAYAQIVSERIIQSVERLQQFPDSGRHLSEFPHLPYREVISGIYRIIYYHDYRHDKVHVTTVVHGSRILRASFFLE
jgi:plasmid stabilization system protein ParE